MRINLIILFSTLLLTQVNAEGFAQRVTLKGKNATLEAVLTEVTRQTGMHILCDGDFISQAKAMDVDFRQASVTEIFSAFFPETTFDFSTRNNTTVVSKSNPVVEAAPQRRMDIQGTVIDDKGVSLPGASVKVKGTSLATSTDANGRFSLSGVDENATLVVTYIGFVTREVPVTAGSINIILQEDISKLNEVVVTALGIERQRASLGYAVSNISSEDIAGFGEPNPISSIAGKVAGVNITSTTAGPTGSSRVVIRGIRELQGSNQPLFVIDGVPAVNGNIGSADQYGGFDLGDGLSDINPNDIESISVLKGASAAALYGSRALNGVILITTKSGEGKKGLGVEFSSSVTVDQVSTRLDERQEVYGQGANGQPQRTALEAGNITQSWGPRYTDLESIIQRDGQLRPYVFMEDNIQSFFQDGVTGINTISLTGGNDRHNIRTSYSNVASKDVIPRSGYDRNNISLRGESKITDKFTLEVKASLMNESVRNRPALTDDVNNIGNGLIGIAGNFDQAWLQEYANPDGSYINYTGDQYRANPYWTINKTRNDSKKQRISGFMNLGYQFSDSWSASLSAGTDFYNFNFDNFYDDNTPTQDAGLLRLTDLSVREDNYQGLINFNTPIGKDFKVSVMGGGNLMKFNRQQDITRGTEIIIPGKSLITNFGQIQLLTENPRKEIQSVFGSTEFGFRDYLFLNLQARNDWSSTLSADNRSYFYPAADMSFIVTEALNIKSNMLSFAKLRTSYGQVGGDTDPYKTRFLYSLTGNSMHGFPMGEILGSTIPNANLRPQRKTSFEIGTDIGLLNDRISLDLTYYSEITDDALLDLRIPQSSGNDFASLNAAKLRNSGVELLLRGTPVMLPNSFRWDVSVNFSKNVNKVLDLYETVDTYTVAEARWAGVTIIAEKGKPFGSIMGNDFVLDGQGRRVHGSDGLPLFTDNPVQIGNSLPDWTGGLINSFSYKGIELKAAIDVRVGGDIFSMSNMTMHLNGSHPNTVEGRDSWNEYQKERRAAEDAAVISGQPPVYPDQNNRGYIGAGVKEDGSVNDVPVNPANYWGRIGNNIPKPFIYDASYVKLRDLGINYTLPRSLFKNVPFQSVSLGIVGRNLWILHKNVPNIDPESNYNNGNGQGFEYGSLPGRRRFGFNLQVKL